jgi:parallel beta-helix repeat protein
MKRKLYFLIFLSAGIISNGIAQKNVVNIADFGAKANDEKFDNTKSFAAAVEFARQNKNYTINVPEGLFYLSRGINLFDSITISGAGMNKTILKLMSGLPPRDNEANQTALFTGIQSYSLSHSGSTKNITVKSLTIDLQKNEKEFDISKFPMLGGIRFINPVNCIIDSIKIIQPQKFGIGLYATQNGMSCHSNTISNCTVVMQADWYLQLKPEIIPRSEESCIGIELSSFMGPNNNGAAIYLNRKNDNCLISKTRKNKINKNTISGGSHGISLSNASENMISENNVSDCSNRGIIIMSCSDSNMITKNTISKSGSTAIHLAYDCNYNTIAGNTVNGVLGVEGDGIKSYVNCNYNRITKNIVSNFAKTGIRVSHGANGNIIENNIINGTKNASQVGIKIIANNKVQYDGGLRFENKLTAKNNQCNKNIVNNTESGVIIEDELNVKNSAH